MGSRGQLLKAGGFEEYHYKTIMRYKKIRFLVQTDGTSIKVPMCSNSPNVIYVTMAKSGDIQSITCYNKRRRIYKQIDFLHNHKGIIGTHGHYINPHDVNPHAGGEGHTLTRHEKSLEKKVERLYEKNGIHDIAHKEYKEWEAINKTGK